MVRPKSLDYQICKDSARGTFATHPARQNKSPNSSVFYLKNKVQTLKNLISFTSDSYQGNSANVNPKNLEVKQNSSSTVDWLLIFLRGFQIYRIGSSAMYKSSIPASLYQSKSKKITHWIHVLSGANVPQAPNALLGYWRPEGHITSCSRSSSRASTVSVTARSRSSWP